MTPPALLLVVGAAGVAGVGSLSEDAIPIYHPKHFTVSSVPGTRTPLGLPGDYKPWVAEIKPGELLIVAFCSPCSGPHNSTASKAGKDEEHALFWRSTDDGKTWGEREYRQDLHGREWALNVLSDGTLLMPNAILSADVFASAGESGAGVWRSTDAGKSWARTPVAYGNDTADAAPEWSVLEVPAKQLPQVASDAGMVTMLGVSVSLEGKSKVGGPGSDPGQVVTWLSTDSGGSWNKTWHVKTDGWSDDDGFFGQTTSYVAASGKMLHAVRADTVRSSDNYDAMALFESTDGGKSWQCRSAAPCQTQNPPPVPHGQPSCIHPHTQCKGMPTFGNVGELYPRFTRLPTTPPKALLTFTVRCGMKVEPSAGMCNSTFDGMGLGLRAVVSHDDGETWDLSHDRFVLSTKDGFGVSGGGYGNTLALASGTLLSVYSYEGKDGLHHVEALRWKLPA